MNQPCVLSVHEQVALGPDGAATCWVGEPSTAVNQGTQIVRMTVWSPDGAETVREDRVNSVPLALDEWEPIELPAHQYDPGQGYTLRVETNPDHGPVLAIQRDLPSASTTSTSARSRVTAGAPCCRSGSGAPPHVTGSRHRPAHGGARWPARTRRSKKAPPATA